ncbi:phage portal protein (plasmid) [Borrelia miyamotoi]|uniref:anti-CBASS protein Acb1 family protein n=1 Tax=Borrelia miyamotoi TaxID=47466 RepID=UPI000B8DAEFA|nr:anti-CBASS Acb1 family protein [Borrelia miyamotoi]ASQ29667.1 phage portal protein [Borrelia miyamotoi]
MLFKNSSNVFDSILFKKQLINPIELYRYSLFFRNYIENAVEDALRPGIKLELLNVSGLDFGNLQPLSLELSEALLEAMISYRFNGVGYILIKPKVLDEDLSKGVNDELPVGFQYLDYKQLKNDRSSDYLEYLQGDGTSIIIHKSRVIIHENFDYILGVHEPVYTQSLLLDICLLEQIYIEIEKRIEQYNFLFYKDEQLVELMQALQDAKNQISTLGTKSRGLFSTFFQNNDNLNTSLGSIGFELDRLFERLKSGLGNNGIFYSADSDASLQVVKYDLVFLRDAFELVKAKIGADTKEPLTRSFNEQVKGLGSDGKGDRANYIDFLHTVQKAASNSVNIKLNKHYRLNMCFNDLVILSDEQKLDRDMKLLGVYSKYLEIIKQNSLNGDEIEILKSKLNFSF